MAIAGIDRVITLPINSTPLDGSTSGDPDGSVTNWFWTKISGPSSFTIVNPSGAITTVNNLVEGIYEFELKVTDNEGLSSKDSIRVIVNAISSTNRPPVANAGHALTINLPNNRVLLDGTGSSDPDNNIRSYHWNKIAGRSHFNIVNPNAVQTEVTNLVEGPYKFELTVTDAEGLVSKDTVAINVDTIISNNIISFYNLWWNDPQSSCAIRIENIYNYFPAASNFDVYLRFIDMYGTVGAWELLNSVNSTASTDWFNYEIVNGVLKIYSLRIDCNFDVGESYAVRIILR